MAELVFKDISKREGVFFTAPRNRNAKRSKICYRGRALDLGKHPNGRCVLGKVVRVGDTLVIKETKVKDETPVRLLPGIDWGYERILYKSRKGDDSCHVETPERRKDRRQKKG